MIKIKIINNIKVFIVILILLLSFTKSIFAKFSNEELYYLSFPSLQVIHFLELFTSQGYLTNKPFHYRKLFDHTSLNVVNPNTDILYSTIIVDIRDTPQVLNLPTSNEYRYQSVTMTDLRGYNFATLVNEFGPYIFAPKDTKIDNSLAKKVYYPESDIFFIIIRTEIKNTEDLEEVHKIQDKITISPLNQIANNIKPLDTPTSKHWVERTQWALLKTRNINRKEVAYKNKVINDLTNSNVLLEEEKKYLVQISKATKNNNETNKSIFGTRKDVNASFLERAAGHLINPFSLNKKHLISPSSYKDNNGSNLNTCNSYITSFPQEVTTEQGFWTVTLYLNQTNTLIPNQQKQYKISSRDARTNFDGTFHLHFGENDNNQDNHIITNFSEDCYDYYVIWRFYQPSNNLLTNKISLPEFIRVK